jgi:hypothetical protein
VLYELSTMPWRCIGEWKYNSTILDLGTRSMVSFTPQLLCPRGNWLSYPLGLVGPTAVLDAVGKRKACPCRESNPGRPVVACCSQYNWPSNSVAWIEARRMQTAEYVALSGRKIQIDGSCTRGRYLEYWRYYSRQGFFSGGTRRNGVPELIWRNNIPKKQK